MSQAKFEFARGDFQKLRYMRRAVILLPTMYFFMEFSWFCMQGVGTGSNGENSWKLALHSLWKPPRDLIRNCFRWRLSNSLLMADKIQLHSSYGTKSMDEIAGPSHKS